MVVHRVLHYLRRGVLSPCTLPHTALSHEASACHSTPYRLNGKRDAHAVGRRVVERTDPSDCTMVWPSSVKHGRLACGNTNTWLRSRPKKACCSKNSRVATCVAALVRMYHGI